MMLDYVLGALFLASLVGLAGLVWRKLPVLRLTDPTQVKRVRDQTLKRELVETRLRRKLQAAQKQLRSWVAPIERRARAVVAPWRGLEQRVQHELEDRTSPARTLEDYLAQAEDAAARAETAAAEQAYLEVLRLDPHHLAAYQGLGELYLAARDYEQAREVYEYLAKRGTSAGNLGLARVASGEGKWEEARSRYLSSVGQAPAVQPRLELARILRELGQLDEALVHLTAARELEPANPKILDACVEVSILGGRPAEARAALEALRQANPDNQKIPELDALVRELEVRLKPKRTERARKSRATSFGIEQR